LSKRKTFKLTIDGHEEQAARTAAKPAASINCSGRATVVSAINVRRNGSVRMATARQAGPIVQDGSASR
jgi:hypothetical protein